MMERSGEIELAKLPKQKGEVKLNRKIQDCNVGKHVFRIAGLGVESILYIALTGCKVRVAARPSKRPALNSE